MKGRCQVLFGIMIHRFTKLFAVNEAENTASHSFRYAVREIFLIFIGVGLALLANNWNDYRIERKQERLLLRQLLTDFRDMQFDLSRSQGESIPDGDLPKAEAIQQLQEQLMLRLAMDDKLNWDSVANDLDLVVSSGGGFFPITTSYETLKSIGLDILRNDSLRNALTSFFVIAVPRVSSSEEAYRQEATEYLNPYILQNFYLRLGTKSDSSNIDTQGIVPINPDLVVRHNSFLNILRRIYRSRSQLIRFYRMAEERIQLITEMLEKELSY